ncbi:hypothetical protein ASC82_12820 [Streptomyces sp. Root431]|nr:hypothetical protein ASC82_12820 [Streptomyces sp. Root431]
MLAVEEPGLWVWAVDPGGMETDLYAAAVPEGIGTRPVRKPWCRASSTCSTGGRPVGGTWRPELTGPVE